MIKMRTKHIFSAFMLTALAAACTNEEFETVNTTPGLNGRVEVGNVTLSLGDADTRFEVGPNFNDLTAAEGDAVGACLIDAPNTEFSGNTDNYKADAKYGYGIVENIYTNYAFKFNGTAWASEAKMVEGNYMFYAPYNAKHVTRKAISAKFNPVQQLVANADGTIDALSTIKELKESGEVMAVSHVFIGAADSKTVKTTLLPVYAYPLVTLTNNYKEKPANGAAVATDLVINQVVISKTNGFPTETTFKFGNGDKTAIAIVEGQIECFVKSLADFSYQKKENNVWKEKAAKGLFAGKNGYKDAYTSNLMTTTAETTSAAIVVKAPKGAYTLKAGASAAFHVVMPAGDYSSEKLTIEIYTNKGVFKNENVDGSIAAGKRYPKVEYNEDGTVKKASEGGDLEAGDTYKVSMTTPESTATAVVVGSTEDLVTLIGNTEEADEDGDAVILEVNPLNKDIKVNAAVMSAIRAKSKAGFTVKFNAPVTIATNISTNKVVEFAAGAEIAEGTITLGNGAKFTGSGKKLDIKGGTVTIEGAEFKDATIENNGGNVTVKSVEIKGNGVTIYSSITSLENKSGSVNLPNSVTGSITNNGGTVTVGDGNKLNNAAKNIATTLTNTKGALEVKANTIATVGANGSYTSATAYTVGTIKNSGTATVTTNSRIGSIENYGTLTADTNDGLIVMANADATVEVTSGGGRIKNNVDAIGITKGTNTVYYEFTEDVNGALIPQAGIYDLIVLNGMTWSPTAKQELKASVEMVDATISVYTPGVKITIPELNVVYTGTNSKSTLKGNAEATIEVTATSVTGDANAKLLRNNVKVIVNNAEVSENEVTLTTN